MVGVKLGVAAFSEWIEILAKMKKDCSKCKLKEVLVVLEALCLQLIKKRGEMSASPSREEGMAYQWNKPLPATA